MAMYQYRDLPQIPSFQEDPQYSGWPTDHMAYRPLVRVEEDYDYSGGAESGMMRMQTMERFLIEPSPISQGVLHAKLNRSGIAQNQQFGPYEQWPTPGLVRYDSPGSSASVSSAYAANSEARSPHYPTVYSSQEEFMPASLPYPTAEHMKEASFAPDFALPGGSISLRDLEYEHEPEPEPDQNVEEGDPVDMRTDGVYEQEPVYEKMDTTRDNYKDYSEPHGSNSLRDAEEVQPIDASEESSSSDADYNPKKPNRRRRSSDSTSSSNRPYQRRRSQHSRKTSSTTITVGTSRVCKRPGRANSSANASKACYDASINGEEKRHFPCPLAAYGCQSTFSSKNEWKRHVGTQHIKLAYWRCDLCATTVDPNDEETFYHNDFNRKDLFTQHLRRMHAAPPNQSARNHKEYPVTEDNIAEHQKRCYTVLRVTPPQSSCLFCPETFTGPTSWENRMEHIGRHLEKDRKSGAKLGDVTSWNVDKALEQWLLEEGIITLEKGLWKIGDGRPRRPLGNEEDESEEA